MKDLSFKIALFGAIFFFWAPLVAQDIDSEVEQMVEEGASDDAIEEYLQSRLPQGRRINLNTATRPELERSGLFTPFQIASLMEYRKDYGALLTMQELALIDGFGGGAAGRLAPFVALDAAPDAARLQLQVRSRYRYKRGVEGLHQYNRVLMEAGGFKAGLLAESDPGEMPLADHLGWYAGYSRGRWSALLGDYSACFGQGLALWNAFSFTSACSPASLMRRSKGVVPYKAADENAAMRGLAVHYCAQDGFCATFFASAAGVDARVGEDGYSSLPVTGYHRTIAEKAAKNAMREYIVGGNAAFRGGQFEAGMTAVAYTYSEHNARKVTSYNKFQMYDGWMGNIAADVAASAGHWRFFAEVAADAGLHPAAVAGAVYSPSYGFEASASLRYYSKAYIAPHAGAYSTISSVSNQAGAVLSLLWRPLRSVLLTSFSEFVHYPGERYRVTGASDAAYQKVRAEFALGALTLSLQDYFVWQGSSGTRKHSLKAAAKGEWGHWKASLRCGAVLLKEDLPAGASANPLSHGVALSASAGREFGKRRHSLSASVSLFDAPDYDARVYLYESDLPGSFSAQYHYGKGIAARCLVKIKPARKLTLTGVVAVSASPECRLQADYNF